jgi:hypothetical protein
MRSTKSQILLFIGFLLIIALSIYYGSYWYDLRQSPWAYSRNPEEKLLIGEWQGDFADPDGVKKHIDLTILLPTTNEQRWENAFKFFSSRSGYSDKDQDTFHGFATVKSKLGMEEYTFYGNVHEDDFHQIFINFSTAENKPKILSNFILTETKKASWQNDKLNLTLQFSYLKADGSSFWSSGVSKYSAKINCGLVRVE